jgi:hypothetical protein
MDASHSLDRLTTMTLNIRKLSVGTENLETLAAFQTLRRAERQARGEPPYSRHVTRMWPKRADEVLATNGSMYWVIKGVMQARQPILDFEEVIGEDGIRRCGIVLDVGLIPIASRACRPFQGWRYFEGKDTPPDLTDMSGEIDPGMPPEMLAELRELGLV